MLSYFDLRKGIKFILEGQPFEVMEFQQIGKAQDVVVAKTKIRNLVTGKVFDKNFHQGDMFEEAEIEKMELKFVYGHRGKFFFSEIKDPSTRFEIDEVQIGEGVKFMKQGQVLAGYKFQGKIINVSLPIKVHLKVIEAPPGSKGDRAQAGNKSVTLETGANINAPLFILEGDIVEVNTETGEYARRIE